MRSLALIALLLACSLTGACSTGPKPLAAPDGHVFRLNPDRWGEGVNDLRQEAKR